MKVITPTTEGFSIIATDASFTYCSHLIHSFSHPKSGVKVVTPTTEGFSIIATDAADDGKTFLLTAQYDDEGPGPGPATGDIPSTYAVQQIADE